MGVSNVSVGYSNISLGASAETSHPTDFTTFQQDEEMAGPSRIEATDSSLDARRDFNSPTRAFAPPLVPPINSSLASHRSSIPAHSYVNVGTSTNITPASLGHTANSHSLSMTSNSLSGTSSTGLRGARTAQAHSIIICGPAGIGKSTLIQMHQANWRRRGLWGHAKMIKGEASPFTGLVSILISLNLLLTDVQLKSSHVYLPFSVN